MCLASSPASRIRIRGSGTQPARAVSNVKCVFVFAFCVRVHAFEYDAVCTEYFIFKKLLKLRSESARVKVLERPTDRMPLRLLAFSGHQSTDIAPANDSKSCTCQFGPTFGGQPDVRLRSVWAKFILLLADEALQQICVQVCNGRV